MKLVSESNRMELEIVDIFKRESEIFFQLKCTDCCFDVSANNVEKSMRLGDWKIIDSESL